MDEGGPGGKGTHCRASRLGFASIRLIRTASVLVLDWSGFRVRPEVCRTRGTPAHAEDDWRPDHLALRPAHAVGSPSLLCSLMWSDSPTRLLYPAVPNGHPCCLFRGGTTASPFGPRRVAAKQSLERRMSVTSEAAADLLRFAYLEGSTTFTSPNGRLTASGARVLKGTRAFFPSNAFAWKAVLQYLSLIHISEPTRPY